MNSYDIRLYESFLVKEKVQTFHLYTMSKGTENNAPMINGLILPRFMFNMRKNTDHYICVRANRRKLVTDIINRKFRSCEGLVLMSFVFTF